MKLLTDLPDDMSLITCRCDIMSASFTAMSHFACADAEIFHYVLQRSEMLLNNNKIAIR